MILWLLAMPAYKNISSTSNDVQTLNFQAFCTYLYHKVCSLDFDVVYCVCMYIPNILNIQKSLIPNSIVEIIIMWVIDYICLRGIISLFQ